MSSTGSTFAGAAVPDDLGGVREPEPSRRGGADVQPAAVVDAAAPRPRPGAPSTVIARLSEASSGPSATATDQTSSASSRTSSSTSQETVRVRWEAAHGPSVPQALPSGRGAYGVIVVLASLSVAGAVPGLDEPPTVLLGVYDERRPAGRRTAPGCGTPPSVTSARAARRPQRRRRALPGVLGAGGSLGSARRRPRRSRRRRGERSASCGGALQQRASTSDAKERGAERRDGGARASGRGASAVSPGVGAEGPRWARTRRSPWTPPGRSLAPPALSDDVEGPLPRTPRLATATPPAPRTTTAAAAAAAPGHPAAAQGYDVARRSRARSAGTSSATPRRPRSATSRARVSSSRAATSGGIGSAVGAGAELGEQGADVRVLLGVRSSGSFGSRRLVVHVCSPPRRVVSGVSGSWSCWSGAARRVARGGSPGGSPGGTHRDRRGSVRFLRRVGAEVGQQHGEPGPAAGAPALHRARSGPRGSAPPPATG